jgi:2-polyprenyl-3-methyl-5-hydroxy-6-metoxy-1,4-benzoquinol methylase
MPVFDAPGSDSAASAAATSRCPICGTGTSRRCLLGRPDHEYGLTQALSYWRCALQACGHVFVAPMPSADTVAGLYSQYSTHAAQPRRPLLAPLLEALGASGIRQITALPGFAEMRCLDFGCGDGALMATLQDRGMRYLRGFDFDPQAVAAARERGLTTFTEETEALDQGPFDLIVLNHVIEHLPEPGQTLARLATHLAPGGRLMLRTPNAHSWLASRFGDDWRGWETPRHLHMFTPRSLAALTTALRAAGVSGPVPTTSNAMFLGIFHESFRAPFWRATRAGKLLRHGLCLLAWPYSELRRLVQPRGGEELCWIGTRG